MQCLQRTKDLGLRAEDGTLRTEDWRFRAGDYGLGINERIKDSQLRAEDCRPRTAFFLLRLASLSPFGAEKISQTRFAALYRLCQPAVNKDDLRRCLFHQISPHSTCVNNTITTFLWSTTMKIFLKNSSFVSDMSRIFATLGILFLLSCISAGSKIPGGQILKIVILPQ